MAERESVSDDPITIRLVPCVRIRSAPRLMPTHIDLVGTVKNQCPGKSNSGNFDESVLWITDYPVSGGVVSLCHRWFEAEYPIRSPLAGAV